MTGGAVVAAFVAAGVAGAAVAAEQGAREVPSPPVTMRLIQEGKSYGIDLPTALGLAGAKNFDVLQAHARLAEARGTRNEMLGRFVPEYTGSFTARRTDGRIQASFGDLARRSFDTFIPATGVELTLNPGRALFDALAAQRRLTAAAADAEQVTQDVLATVAQLYFGLQRAQARVRIAEEAVAAAREFARIGVDRERVGTGLKVDVLRGEARVAADEARLAEARRSLREASVHLAMALRLDPTVTLFPLETVVRQRTLVDPGRPLDELMQRAVGSRPDLAARRRQVAAAESGHDSTWADAVGPNVYGSFEESAIGTRVGDLGNRQIYGGFVGFRLSPASIGRVQAAAARVEHARLDAERLEQEVVADVIAARERVLSEEEQMEAALRGVGAAEAAHGLTEVRYRGGAGVGLEVLDAQAALTESRTNLVTSIVAYDGAQVALLRAMGAVSVPALLGESATRPPEAAGSAAAAP